MGPFTYVFSCFSFIAVLFFPRIMPQSKSYVKEGQCILSANCGSLEKCTPSDTLEITKWPNYCKDFWQSRSVCCSKPGTKPQEEEDDIRKSLVGDLRFGRATGRRPARKRPNKDCNYQEFSLKKSFLDDMDNLLATTLCRDYWPKGLCCAKRGVSSSSTKPVMPLKNNSIVEDINAFTGIRGQQPTKAKYPPGIITRIKCDEYSKWLSTDLRIDDAPKVAGKCRRDFFYNGIYGGEEADPLEFAHIANLGYREPDDDLSWRCGGSLISENFVVTAAHCQSTSRSIPINAVRLGSFGRTEVIPVVEIIVHPDYDTKSNNYFNDIALLRLQKKVKFNNYKRPICLQANRNFKEDKAKIAGWGRTDKGEDRSALLLQVEVPISDNKKCADIYRPRRLDFETQICAGELESKKDACDGDSGGPLQIPLDNPRCMYSLVGLTSFGIKCGLTPGVYTRISGYIGWIESVVWPDFVIPTNL